MAGMEVDSPPERNSPREPRHRIVQRLVQQGVPLECVEQSQWGLVTFVKENRSFLPEIVSAILPTDVDVSEPGRSFKSRTGGSSSVINVKEFGESMLWLQWLMFEGEPQASLQDLAQKAAGKRAVCGAVWGQNDLAYRCRTCEHDPTCAICVPCFQNGNHKDHDYSIMYTGGGCCDCGDITAWKREGFCSKHKGTEQILPLPENLANSVGPVLDALLACWKDKVSLAEHQKCLREGDHSDVCCKVANKLSYVIVDMLLDFCKCSESLLSFISRRMFQCIGLLDVLVRAERFLDDDVVKKLHELLLKLLGEPLFKYEFAKAFTRYYPVTVSEIIKERSDSMLAKYPLLSTFSVQIFTVPTLTPRLVREVNLLGVLLGCLRDIFLFCVGEDNRIQVNKWTNLHETTIRLVEDTRYVLSHEEVPKYIAHERPDISRTWIKLLSLVQGMDALKRATRLHTEEENEHLPAPFGLGHFLGHVNTLLVPGALSVVESKEIKDVIGIQGLNDSDSLRNIKVGRISQECSTSSLSSRNSGLEFGLQYHDVNIDIRNHLSIPSSAIWLIFECLKALEGCLEPETAPRNNSFSSDALNSGGYNLSTLRRKLFRRKKSTNSNKVYRTSVSRERIDGDQVPTPSKLHERHGHPLIHGVTDGNSMDVDGTADMYTEHASTSGLSDDSLLEVDLGTELEALGLLNMADWPDIVYDVSSQEISFHIPLHRLLSLLLREAMKTCYGETEKLEKAIVISSLPSSAHHHEFFGQVLGSLQPCGFSAFVMEHPLRLRVFCAQVRAGMWRKNGDAAILSAEWYRSVQWFEQGQESDLFLLQCCAALAPPELFVRRIQERFGLSNFTSLNLAEHNEYEPVLVQEMLTLIIQIVKERRFSGLSLVENLKRELVYKLATGDATHSQLVKALPRDLSKSNQLQNVVDMLAVYSNPSGMKQGKYSLRKAYWKELDLYHPRWNYRDLQVAEERYFQFCKISALNVQLPRWTAVFEPLTTISRIATSKVVLEIVRAVLFYAVSTVSRTPDSVLITALHLLSLALDICDSQTHDNRSCISFSEGCFPILTYASEEFGIGATNESIFWKNQSLLSLLVSLMRMHKEERDNSFSETRQCNISSLIENLLKRFAQLSTDCMDVLKQLAPDMVHQMLQQFPDPTIQNSASSSDAEERRAKAREHQAAIMAKMRAEQSRFIASLKSMTNDEPDVPISKQEVSNPEVDHVPEESSPLCALCHDPDSQSPLCFLILLQKSRLTSFVERGPPSWENGGQLDKEIKPVGKEGLVNASSGDSSSPAQLVQAAGLDFSIDIEPAEGDAFLYFFKERFPDIRNQLPAVSCDTGTDTLSIEMMEDEIYQSIIGDIRNIEFHSEALDGEQTCSTFHVPVVSKKNRNIRSSVLGECIAFLSRETSRRHSSIHNLQHLENLSSMPTSSTAKFNRFGPSNCDGIHLSSCGHAVHQECHDRYLSSLKQRRRLGFEGVHIVDPDLGELLCPVCRRFANSILPAFPYTSNKAWRKTASSVNSATQTNLLSISSDLVGGILRLPLALSILQSTAKMVGQNRFLKAYSGKPRETIEPALEPALRKLFMLYYPHSYSSLSASGWLSHSLILWDTLKYSIMSTEIAARGRPNMYSAGSNSCLESLYGELRSSSGSILSFLLHVAQSARSSNCLEVLLRFRGIQLLAGSICSAVSGDSNLSNADEPRGTFSSMLECSDKGATFPDAQFWKQAADPILAQDSFSSLMSVLFCLPLPFMSSSECFIPFVHLFYAVCVVQALIACYSKHGFDISSFGDGLLNNICKSMAESVLVRQYFVSNYVDTSCLPKDMIRRLTFPYLRRCALLWELLKSSTLAPLYDSSNTWEWSNLRTNNDALDATNHLTIELNGIKELEDMLQIPSLELVLKDEVVHALSLKWSKHFCEVFRIRKHRGVLFSTPAVPFKLMQLPRLYQDLLQRYVKLQCFICKAIPEEPALCLLCGKLCSSNWKPCCGTSKCLNHAAVCGAGIGVFLLVRKTIILLQRSARQAFWPSLYLDAFGEEDHDVCRGKPLYLSEARYAALAYLVASHGLDRTSEVLRQTTISFFGAD
uniref:E3 ubiquitin-protein ligase n=2 Tax=Elaeis guineensis var. tenera TaxID=51953 RepID=A0A6I9SDI2_ELAGV|nr:E3 ubiquitin-protein ligase PRT6 isoform X1 [Elaeis guineensis]XP_010937623.1 E3 ubiquitin-protein ligase PRT6 isoform X1 [Elaeis guineensis]